MDLLLESGKVDQRVAFYAPPGLSSFTVYRQRGVNGAAAMTTPDIVEDATVPGLYRLLLDEDTTITAGKTTESLAILVQADGMTTQLLRVVLFISNLTHVLGTALQTSGSGSASIGF